MNVLRLAWSGYQTEQALNKEKKRIEDAGFNYRRALENGVVSGDLEQVDVVIINSQYSVGEPLLDPLNGGALITASSGYDHVPIDACKKHNVTVIRTPESRAKRVADHTMTLIKSLIRDIPRSSHALRRGNWTRAESFRRVDRLSSLSVGILGFGVIGQRVAESLGNESPYELLAWDPHKQGTIEQEPGIELVSFEPLMSRTNVLTIHANLTDRTNNMIDREQLQALKEPSYLVNTARGNIVDVGDLINGLNTGDLEGAALDVYPEEPFVPDTNSLPENLITTPHTAGFGPGLLNDLTEEIITVLEKLAAGHRPRHTVSSNE